MVVTVLSVIQVIACLFLIVTILLQKAPSRGMSGVLCPVSRKLSSVPTRQPALRRFWQT